MATVFRLTDWLPLFFGWRIDGHCLSVDGLGNAGAGIDTFCVGQAAVHMVRLFWRGNGELMRNCVHARACLLFSRVFGHTSSVWSVVGEGMFLIGQGNFPWSHHVLSSLVISQSRRSISYCIHPSKFDFRPVRSTIVHRGFQHYGTPHHHRNPALSEMTSRGPAFRDELTDRYGLSKDQLVEAFGQARDEWIGTDFQSWLEANSFYPVRPPYSLLGI